MCVIKAVECRLGGHCEVSRKELSKDDRSVLDTVNDCFLTAFCNRNIAHQWLAGPVRGGAWLAEQRCGFNPKKSLAKRSFCLEWLAG